MSKVECCGTCVSYSVAKGVIKKDNMIVSNTYYGLCYTKSKVVFIFESCCKRYIVDPDFKDLIDY